MTEGDTESAPANRDDATPRADRAASYDDNADGKRKAPEPSGEKVEAAAKPKEDDGEDEKAQREEKAEQEARQKRRPLVISIGVVIVLLLIAGGLYYWLTTRNIESTDDAYTDGRAVTIAPQVSGDVRRPRRHRQPARQDGPAADPDRSRAQYISGARSGGGRAGRRRRRSMGASSSALEIARR